MDSKMNQTELLQPTELDRAAELLLQGEIVAFPTETVYGLGAMIWNEEAVKKIYLAKGRPSDNPLIAHVSSLEQIHSIARELPKNFYKLYEAFFPGPLTVVLKKQDRVPSLISGGLDTIALRMPSHPLARELISLVNEPIVAPSANLSGKPSSTHPQHVLDDFEGKIAAVVVEESCELGLESTVISLLSDTPVLLRPGHIAKENIEEVLRCSVQVYQKNSDEKVLSPGLKYRHYAPKAPIVIMESLGELSAYLNSTRPQKRMLLSLSGELLKTKECDEYCLSSKSLYARLRDADKAEYEEILVVLDPALKKNAALMNRLLRAAQSS